MTRTGDERTAKQVYKVRPTVISKRGRSKKVGNEHNYISRRSQGQYNGKK